NNDESMASEFPPGFPPNVINIQQDVLPDCNMDQPMASESISLGVNFSEEDIHAMENAIGCRAANLPFKYLGVPVGGNMGRCSNWDPVIQKFSSKLSIWKARLLSAGEIDDSSIDDVSQFIMRSISDDSLRRYVFFARAKTAYMNCYLLQISIRLKIGMMDGKCWLLKMVLRYPNTGLIRIISHFSQLWVLKSVSPEQFIMVANSIDAAKQWDSDLVEARYIMDLDENLSIIRLRCWKECFTLSGGVFGHIETISSSLIQILEKMLPLGHVWDVVCLPKNEGGLGLRRLDQFNKALMVSHIWKLLSLKESLWVRWVHAYKLKGRSFWDIPLRGNMSWGWRNILHLRPISAGLNPSSKLRDIIFNGAFSWPPVLSDKYSFLQSIIMPNVLDRRDLLEWRNELGLVKSFSIWSHMSRYTGMNSVGSVFTQIVSAIMPFAKRKSSRSVIAKLVLAACAYFVWQEWNEHLFKNSTRFFFPVGAIGYVIAS
nr:hypothetical protein [Tanacetum cinerariifolium]